MSTLHSFHCLTATLTKAILTGIGSQHSASSCRPHSALPKVFGDDIESMLGRVVLKVCKQTAVRSRMCVFFFFVVVSFLFFPGLLLFDHPCWAEMWGWMGQLRSLRGYWFKLDIRHFHVLYSPKSVPL